MCVYLIFCSDTQWTFYFKYTVTLETKSMIIFQKNKMSNFIIWSTCICRTQGYNFYIKSVVFKWWFNVMMPEFLIVLKIFLNTFPQKTKEIFRKLIFFYENPSGRLWAGPYDGAVGACPTIWCSGGQIGFPLYMLLMMHYPTISPWFLLPKAERPQWWIQLAWLATSLVSS